MQGWGVAVLVGVPNKDAVFMTKPINVLNERTLKGTFFGNYKPRTDLPSVVDMYMNKVLSFSHALTSFGFLYTRLCHEETKRKKLPYFIFKIFLAEIGSGEIYNPPRPFLRHQ